MGVLKEVVTRMGFDERWIGTIMRCISFVLYSVLSNGKVGERFHPSRGLRQGDPSSLFLFLICSEGLSSLMRLPLGQGFIRGAKASWLNPLVSHILFVDDCILFGEATSQGTFTLKGILKEYESYFGQCVNFDKSLIFYNTNTPVGD